MQHSSVVIKVFPVFAFFVCALFFWPGLMRPDSIVQMQQGIAAGIASDFHPPMMGVLWGLFDKLYSGSGSMFLFHLSLYWGAVFLFACAQPQKAIWVYFIAILPPVFAYQLLVIKDISFVNAYLFCAAWLHFYSMRGLRPGLFSRLAWFVIAFYGTCATYQAAIALPWLCLWFAKFYWPDSSKKWIGIGLLLCGIFIVSVTAFNKTMSTPSNRGIHAKLYDLAGISINLNDPVFPDYIKQNKLYNFEKVKQLYNPNRVDDLTFANDSPLTTAASPDQEHILYKAWMSAIIAHPAAYIKHRWGIFYQQLTVSLSKPPSSIKGETTSTITTILNLVERLGIFTVASWFMAYIMYFFIQLIYIYNGYKRFNEHPKYVSLFFQNIMGVALVLSLFFIAGAAEARYAYLAIAMFYLSHPFSLKRQAS